MRIKATILAYVFSVQYFENVTTVAYVGLRNKEQTSRNLLKFYLAKVSDEKFTEVFLHQRFVLYDIFQEEIFCECTVVLRFTRKGFHEWLLTLMWL